MNITRLKLFIFILFAASPYAFAQDLSLGLIAYYPFECSPNDISGSANHGIISGNPACIPGKFNDCYSFSGADFIDIAGDDPKEFMPASGFTWACWFNPDQVPVGTGDKISQVLISAANQKVGQDIILGFGTLISSENKLAWEVDGQGGVGDVMFPISYAPAGGFNNGEWIHVAGVRDYTNNQAILYVNGIEVAKKIVSGKPITDNDMKVNIGCFNDGGGDIGHFKGAIDDVRIYNKPLNSSEVALLHQINPGQLFIDNFEPAINLRCNADTSFIINLKNLGPSDLNINSTTLSAGNVFEIANGAPISIINQQEHQLIVLFKPNSSGRFFDTLTISNTDINVPAAKIFISANKDTVSAKFPDKTFFGKVVIGESKDTTIAIVNDGTLSWNVFNEINETNGAFEIVAFNPPFGSFLNPNDTLWITIRFNATPGMHTDFIRLEHNNPCEDNHFDIVLAGEGAYLADIQLSIPDISAEPGQIVDVPVYLDFGQNIIESEVTAIAFNLVLNASIFINQDNELTESMINPSEFIIPLQIPVSPDAEGKLASFKFKIALGNSATDSIKIQDVRPVGGLAQFSIRNAQFNLLNLCANGGIRLFDAYNFQAGIHSVAPNPASERVNLSVGLIEEDSELNIFITDAAGNQNVLLNTFIDKAGVYSVPVDLANVAAGIYLITIKTPYRCYSQNIVVFK